LTSQPPPVRPIPAYQRIRKAIWEQIESGELKPGARIRSERELALLHGVSLMTARHALQELEADGVVTRHIGAGTFVAPPKIHFNKLLGFSEAMSSRGLTVQTRLLSCKTVDDGEDIAARLKLPPGSRLVRLERLRLGDKEPFALETVYLSHALFGGVSRRQFENRSLFEMFEREHGMTLAYADEEVDATSADGRTARLLDVQPGAALLRIRQLLYVTSGEPVLFDIGLYRSDRHSLNIRRYR
jgi:GntR family transcriptional regulator